jgi:DNA polymerase III alpha subunit
METQSNDPKGRARTFGELKSFGYEIVPIDINYASDQWTILDGKKFMPSFNTVKALGAAAACEIVANRPYSNIHELLWDSSGRWKHSKFNKRALENLIRAEAFGSMNIIGTVFESYKHMHKVLIEESSALKHKKGQESLDTIIAKHAGCGEWTRDERVANHIGIIGYVPIDIVVSSATRKMLTDLGVSSIDSTSEEKELAWFIIDAAKLKKTKNGKSYVLLTAYAETGHKHKIFCWGATPSHHDVLIPGKVCVAELSQSDFGYSASIFKLKFIE